MIYGFPKLALTLATLTWLATPQATQAGNFRPDAFAREWKDHAFTRVVIRNCIVSDTRADDFVCNIVVDGKVVLTVPAQTHRGAYTTREYRDMLQFCYSGIEDSNPTCWRLVQGFLYERDGKPGLSNAAIMPYGAGQYPTGGD